MLSKRRPVRAEPFPAMILVAKSSPPMSSATDTLARIGGRQSRTDSPRSFCKADDMQSTLPVDTPPGAASRAPPASVRRTVRGQQLREHGSADSPRARGADYVTIPVAAAMTGYSAKAIRRKIEAGVWLEGREFRRAPDGHVLISVKGYELWVERGRA